MSFLDMKTVFTAYVVSSGLCAVVMALLWRQNRRRSPEILLWLVDYILQFGAILLITLRGVAPDILSVVVANVMVIAGTIAAYIGLERFVGRVSRQWHNWVMLFVFTAVHSYYTFVQPSLAARNINASAGLLFICAQLAWLLLWRVDRQTRRETLGTGLVFLAFCVVSVAHIANNLVRHDAIDLFASGPFDSGIILVTQTLFVALTFALVLLVTQRLLSALENDIADREVAELALKKSEEKFRVAFATVPDAILITLLSDGTIIEVNDGYTDITGFSKEESLGRTTLELGLWTDPADRELFVGKIVSHGRASQLETHVTRKTGEVFPAVLSGELVELEGEQSVLAVFEDATDRRIAEDRLKELSTRDSLTGLLNHRAFYEEAEKRIATAPDSWIALVFMDLDRLKAINDEYGHPAGDQALMTFSEALRRGFRESDLIGRLGGDEFAVLAVSREQVADDALVGRYLLELGRLNEAASQPFAAQASAGIAWRGPGEAADLQELITVADARMYEAKRALG